MNSSSRFSSSRGSALVVVLMFGLVLLLLAGSITTWSLSERRMNSRNAAWLEARNAAEAIAEYGCYQVAQAFNTRLTPTFTATGTNPISFPATLATSFFANGHVDLSQNSSHVLTNVDLRVGNVHNVPATGYNLISSSDPNNKYDPLVGRYVRRRDVTVLAKATVIPPTGGAPVTAYVEEKVSVRGAPLLAYAIFYSGNDLEFNETPQMDIYGAVHVNGNLFVGPAGTNPQPLSFHGPVTASGNVFHAWRGTTTTAQEGGSGMSTTTAVSFATDATGNALANMRTSGGVWNDSTMGADAGVSGLTNLQNLVTAQRSASFSQYASQTWRGNLQTAAMGIQAYNPMGFSEVVAHDNTTNTDIQATDPRADDGSVVGTGSGYGHGYGPHALIEPPQTVSSSDTYASAKTSIEQSKFSRKAGLYIQVTVSSGNAPTFKVYGDPNSAPVGTPSANIGPNGGLLYNSAVPSGVIQFIPYSQAGTGSSTVVNTGIYDQRQGSGVNLVQINMGALRTAIANMATSGAGNATTDFVNTSGNRVGIGTNLGYDPDNTASTGYNGGIYVDVVNNSTTPTALILGNARIPSGSSIVPPRASAPNGTDGLTIATNAPVYVLGNFNADGAFATGTPPNANSALYPDDYPGTSVANSAEAPVAIACDALTVLSPNYFGTNSGNAPTAPLGTAAGGSNNGNNTSAGKSKVNSAPAASNSVEIAAAIITGTVSTSPDSTGTQMYSGGVHNLPRFLETWNNGGQLTVAIRGSMVSMFNSRVATAGWQQFYYSAPIRQWGYDQLFANGRYPPICPQVISYRRVDFTYLKNVTEYNAELATL